MATASVSRVCKQCGKEFTIERWRLNRSGHTGDFCSRACSNSRDRSTYKPRNQPPLAERFMAKVDKGDGTGCWLWTGGKYTTGYGVFGDPRQYTHRMAWELHFGVIPEGMEVCHHCDVPACVRPSHLFLGTHAHNMADKVAKGRQPKGEQRPDAKLTDEAVRQIRIERAAGISRKELAAKHHVSPATVSNICSRKSWRHVV